MSHLPDFRALLGEWTQQCLTNAKTIIHLPVSVATAIVRFNHTVLHTYTSYLFT